MKQKMVVVGLVAGFFLTFVGCARITTQVVEKPRVDQEVKGNRGYLVGSAPASSKPRQATRQVIETNVELPTMDELNPWRKPAKITGQTSASPVAKIHSAPEYAPEPEWEDEARYPQTDSELAEPMPVHPRAVKGASYTVKKGDTLQKISEQFYGTTRKWKKIYDANRDHLKSPDRVYAGQKLMIPEEEGIVSQESGAERNFK